MRRLAHLGGPRKWTFDLVIAAQPMARATRCRARACSLCLHILPTHPRTRVVLHTYGWASPSCSALFRPRAVESHCSLLSLAGIATRRRNSLNSYCYDCGLSMVSGAPTTPVPEAFGGGETKVFT